ncbi:hypothetical protein D3C85_1425200 [compost metagenome]
MAVLAVEVQPQRHAEQGAGRRQQARRQFFQLPGQQGQQGVGQQRGVALLQRREQAHGGVAQRSNSALTSTSRFSASAKRSARAVRKPNRLATNTSGNCSMRTLLLLTASL